MDLLKEFFALTVSRSIYLAEIDGICPSITKVEGQTTGWEVGHSQSNKKLAIAHKLILFEPEVSGLPSLVNIEDFAQVNSCYWGAQTSSIAALFLDFYQAKACLNAPELTCSDQRWRNKTIEVLKAIGPNHPQCSISKAPNLRLVKPEEWLTL